MSLLKDLEGRTWSIVLTLGAAQRIDAADATAVYDKPIVFLDSKKGSETFFEDLLINDGLSMFLIWCIVYPQALKMQPPVTQDEFADALGPEEIQQAKEILWDQLTRFFPERKTLFCRLISFWKESYQKADEILERNQGKVFQIVEQEIQQEVDRALNGINGNAGEISSSLPKLQELQTTPD